MANIHGTDRNDLLLGTNGADTIEGRKGHDSIQAGGGNDTVWGNAGDDTLFGNKGSDSINAGQGDDTIVWTNGDGSDVVDGGAGFDTQRVEGSLTAGETFTLGAGGTGGALFQRSSQVAFSIDMDNVEKLVLKGFGGDDSFSITGDLSKTELRSAEFFGGDGNDTANGGSWTLPLVLDGETGDDDLTGGAGNDWLVGGQLDAGADKLSGGAGDDLIEGNAGDDILTGGEGADVFLVEADGGLDTIQDFVSGEDRIALRDFVGPGGAPLTWDDLSGKISVSGGNTTIDLTSFGADAAADTITVLGYGTLTESDFAFI